MGTPVKTKRSGCLMLFGLPFFLVGVGFMFWMLLPSIYDGWRMQDWPSVQGQLLHADLSVSHSSDSTTYGVKARYRYNVLGRDFENDRPAITTTNDNIGDFQERLGNHLEYLYRNHQPVTVYYNPSDPADSILNREIRWGMFGFYSIFIVVFGGAGAGMVYWGWSGKKTIDTPEAGDKPWLKNPDWQGGVVRSSAKSGMMGIWAFAILWNLISAPAAILGFPEVWNDEGLIALLILLFPLVGMGMLYWAIKMTMEWRRFGITPLTLDPFPGSIGGDVAGEIKVKMPYDPEVIYKVTLSCIHSYVSGSGKNRSRRESAKWQDEGYASPRPAADGINLQFRFNVPAGLKESEEHSSSYYFWRVNIEADLKGVDLDRSFEIPVYATSETSQRIRIDSTKEKPRGVPEVTVESLLPMTRTGNTTEIYYPMFRKIGQGIGIMLFGSIFFGAGWFLWGQAAKEGFMLYMMSSIFSLVGGAILLWGLYSLLNALRVRYDGQSLQVTRTVLGLKISHDEVAYFEIQSVKGEEGMKSSSGNKHSIQYKVIAKTSGKKLTLAEGLKSASQKEMIVEYFEKEFVGKGGRFEI